jgi:hypothetical protein
MRFNIGDTVLYNNKDTFSDSKISIIVGEDTSGRVDYTLFLIQSKYINGSWPGCRDGIYVPEDCKHLDNLWYANSEDLTLVKKRTLFDQMIADVST